MCAGGCGATASGSTRNASQYPPVSTVPGLYSEWIAHPSLSSSRRVPSGYWTTRAYWYSVSASVSTLPLWEPLTVPPRTAISAAMASGTSAPRRRSPSAATAAVISANVRNVRWVPTSGISSSAAANVPSSEPTVEIAYIRPAISPESSTACIFSRIAHGDTEPSISTGTATSTSTPNSEPANVPTEYWSKASTLSDRNGPATNGTSAISTEATRTVAHSAGRFGRRSAIRPPNQ